MGAMSCPCLYPDTNSISKLGREEPALLERFEAKLAQARLRVVPATESQLAELLRNADAEQRVQDLELLHRWTMGTSLDSHNDVLATYVMSRLAGD